MSKQAKFKLQMKQTKVRAKIGLNWSLTKQDSHGKLEKEKQK